MTNTKKYLAAVSGGPDSMALLHKYQKQIKLVCHVNYQKRKESHDDEKIVNDFCKKHHINIEILRVSKKLYEQYRKKHNNNFQNIARHIRYDFFVKKAKQRSLRILLIAHNKDDFIETALMQTMRKTKSLFLGIKQKNDYHNLHIYRPLLYVWKSNLLSYCNKFKVPYAMDKTNEQIIYQRNYIRKELAKKTLRFKDKVFTQIKKLNDASGELLKKMNDLYKIWKKSNYNVTPLRNSGLGIKNIYHLTHQMLIDYSVPNISLKKNKLVTDFILHSKNNNKKVRLGNGLFLFIKNNQIKIK